MKNKLFLLLTFVLCADMLSAQIINKEPLSERITGYKMDVSLDDTEKTVSGSMEAFWVNNTDETVPDIQLHMYMNAFKSKNTTMYKEMQSSPGNSKMQCGWIDINSFKDDKGEDLMPLIKYIQPDDGNVSDSTVIRIVLPEPVLPGDTVRIFVDFTTKLPLCSHRTGYNDDFFFVGQWFPKFGVYEPKGMRYSDGAWNCHQFHANSEFYSDHSVYEVNITTPLEYVVGTGGIMLSENKSGETKTQLWRAEDIVDFAWTAYPDYLEFTDTWKDVNIRLLLPPEKKNQVQRHFVAIKNALDFFTKNVGPYPWPYMTIVDPPAKGGGSDGMEYTTLFTTGSMLNMPKQVLISEMVTVHEFGHAYFMGILATNEFEEPWMDEGINTFFEERIMDSYWTPDAGYVNTPFIKLSDKTVNRMSYLWSNSRSFVSNDNDSWSYPNYSYSMMSYSKAGTWLYSLMGVVGEETTNEIFREYYRRWAFKHPCATDFIDVVNDVVTKRHGDAYGENMNWFFDQVLYGTQICDYRVSNIYNVNTEKGTESTVFLSRDGDMIMPIEVLIHFSNGDEQLEYWDGKERYKSFEYLRGKGTKVTWVKIDPEYKNRMDANFTNNSKTLERDKNPIKKMANKLMAWLQVYLLMF